MEHAIFSKYSGARDLEVTSIDDIPLSEQQAFFASKGWAYGDQLAAGEQIPDERDDEMYAAWFSAQIAYVVPA